MSKEAESRGAGLGAALPNNVKASSMSSLKRCRILEAPASLRGEGLVGDDGFETEGVRIGSALNVSMGCLCNYLCVFNFIF